LPVDVEVVRRRSSLDTLIWRELPKESKALSYVNAWAQYITAVIITVFLVHPSIVQMTFALLNCKKLGALDDDYYLIEDMGVQCWKGTHFVFVVAIAIPMLIFYVFGMPLFVLYRLYKNKAELTKEFKDVNPHIIDRYHFLIKGYEPRFYYWEIVIMIRKILMVSIAVFFSYDIQIQSLLATLLCVTALCVHSLACPYVTNAMDGLELLSLIGSFCTYFFGQFLFTESIGALGKTIVSFIIVFVNLSVMTAIFVMGIGEGMSMVAAFGAKVRNMLCCKSNNKSETAEIEMESLNDEDNEDDDDEDDKPSSIESVALSRQISLKSTFNLNRLLDDDLFEANSSERFDLTENDTLFYSPKGAQ